MKKPNTENFNPVWTIAEAIVSLQHASVGSTIIIYSKMLNAENAISDEMAKSEILVFVSCRPSMDQKDAYEYKVQKI